MIISNNTTEFLQEHNMRPLVEKIPRRSEWRVSFVKTEPRLEDLSNLAKANDLPFIQVKANSSGFAVTRALMILQLFLSENLPAINRTTVDAIKLQKMKYYLENEFGTGLLTNLELYTIL